MVKLIKVISSCETIGQCNTCFEWMSNLDRLKIFTKTESRSLFSLLNSQERMLKRKMEANFERTKESNITL